MAKNPLREREVLGSNPHGAPHIKCLSKCNNAPDYAAVSSFLY